MTSFILLVIIWTLTFLLVPEPPAALVLAVLATATMTGMGHRVTPKSGLAATASVLFGAFLDAQGLAGYAMPAVGFALVLVMIWMLAQRRKGGTANS